MTFKNTYHTNCGGAIELFPSQIIENTEKIVCTRCLFNYVCEDLERPIEVVYRLISEGVLFEK